MANTIDHDSPTPSDSAAARRTESSFPRPALRFLILRTRTPLKNTATRFHACHNHPAEGSPAQQISTGPHTRCMREAHDIGEVVLREVARADTAACVSLWVEACATRDGRSVAGVAGRTRPKFDHVEAWILAEHPEFGVLGFVLATPPGAVDPLIPRTHPS